MAFGLKHSGLSTAEKQARVRWALETVGFSFEKVHDQPPMGLSGGEKRRCCFRKTACCPGGPSFKT